MSLEKTVRFLQNFKYGFNSIQLKNKLLICYGSLIVLSVAFIGIFSYCNMERYIFEQTGNSLNQTLIQLKINVEDRLNTYDALMNQTASDKNFVYAISNQYISPADYSYEYLNTISKVLEMKEKDNSILGLYIFKNNETLPENGLDLISLDKAMDSEWFSKYFADSDSFSIKDFIRVKTSRIWFATNEKIRSSTNLSTRIKDGWKIVVIKPVIFDYQKLIGVLELFLDYDSVFGDFILDDSMEDRIFISDENNRIVFDSCGEKQMESKLDEEFVRQLTDKKEGRFQLEKYDKLIIFSKGEKSGWTFFREVPLKKLFTSAKAVREVTIAITIISVVISFIIGIAIASMLSRRTSILLNKMKQVKDLSLDVSVDIGGNDEIGNLARGYNEMIEKIRDLVEQLKRSQFIHKEAEMKALQAQINPHFLYNTLATISWMAMSKNNDKIISMVDSLSAFYRLSLNKGRSFLKVRDEIIQVKAYTYIQEVRLENRINVVYDVMEDISDCYMPKLTIQPFVENAILHGSDYKDCTTNIVVRGYRSGENIILEIIDDGIGMRNVPEQGMYHSTGGYGIRNVNDKIRLHFGSGYGVGIYSKIGIGTKVCITIPILAGNPEKEQV